MAVVSSNLNAGGHVRNSAIGGQAPNSRSSIECYPSGDFVDLADPRPEMIHLRDIAHHLAMTVRYAGGIARFYSVAEHSALVHDLIPKLVDPARQPTYMVQLQRAALLHDAPEAYLHDLT